MASGRRDYTWGFLNEAAIEGRHIDSFIRNDGAVIVAGGQAFLYKYTVPADYKLLINRVFFYTTSRVRNFGIIEINTYAKAQIYFAEDYCFVFSDQNPFCVNEGEEIEIVCHNYDEIDANFYVTLVGILESLIS